MTVKIELHKVNPYEILWIGEKPYDRRGQEETFVRFTIDSKGKVVGAFTHEQKKFVVPKFGSVGGGTAPNSFESEDGDRVDGPNGGDVESGTEESRFGTRDPEHGAGEFP